MEAWTAPTRRRWSPRRNETLTALQALALLNDKFMLRMSEHLAERAEKAAPDLPGRVDAAFRLALGRPPTEREKQILAGVAEREGLSDACRVIFNTNEFVVCGLGREDRGQESRCGATPGGLAKTRGSASPTLSPLATCEGGVKSRREFLWRYGGGLGGVALAGMLHRAGLLYAAASSPAPPTAAPAVRSAARAGCTSRPRPSASSSSTCPVPPASATRSTTSRCSIKQHGQKWDPGEKVQLFQSEPGACMQSPWEWKRYGQSGKMINDCVAPLGDCVDDMAFVHNMVSKSNVHGPATFMQATGFILPGFPSAGAWVSYGLGSLSDNLPDVRRPARPARFRPQRAEELGRRLPPGRAPGNDDPGRHPDADRRPVPAAKAHS